MKPVVIVGAGDMAEVAHTYFTHDSEFDVVAFTVHERYLTENRTLLGRDIVPFEQLTNLYPPTQVSLFVGIGFSQMNKSREAVYNACKTIGYQLVTYVNSRVSCWGELNVGDNCFILDNNVINPFVTIGNNVVLWSGNHIGHHSTVHDHCFISSHAVIAGGVTIKSHCFIGINATIRDNITVERACLIGAGAIILKDTVPEGIYRAKETEPARLKTSQLRGQL